ncbi:MAG: hypothetical protein IJJ34_08030 [Clostridia bacterium]|nr:hypothetical protein [Clostridia bacterium]
MRYSMDETIREIEKRGEKIRARRVKRMIRTSSGVALASLTVLVLSASRMICAHSVQTAGGAYGSFLLSGKAGGYVLVGVICFFAAVLLTVLAMRFAEKKRNGKG